ncbi:hypothetical protein Rsub_04609 [Raphidocelis subcapitata]|uniref:MYND-type domain-containing protein n=1 Tax=Raphidocelis subcapitata TaxID=307507 RepID=A0A2V0P602_9CHLO|nr:hypothetical protein Rsub_04609 [Raphidocelis subcapitata]|eukprot:GBF92505.1 hypothetical protein Rsub_04609 [Raphidocelis subcapitata]
MAAQQPEIGPLLEGLAGDEAASAAAKLREMAESSPERITGAPVVAALLTALAKPAAAADAAAALRAVAESSPEAALAVLAAPGALSAIISALGGADGAKPPVDGAPAALAAAARAAGREQARRVADAAGAVPALVRLIDREAPGAQDALNALVEAGAAIEVAAALGELLEPATAPAARRARALLLSQPLALPEVAVDALAICAANTAKLRVRVAALEALLAAAAAEMANRPELCAACKKPGSDQDKLRPCAGCAGGPAGRILYHAGCQRGDWARHRTYCRAAAAVAAAAAPAAASAPAAAAAAGGSN